MQNLVDLFSKHLPKNIYQDFFFDSNDMILIDEENQKIIDSNDRKDFDFPTCVESLLQNYNPIYVLSGFAEDTRKSVLGIKIGNRPSFEPILPILMIAYNTENDLFDFFINVDAKIFQILLPLSIALTHDIPFKISSLFGYSALSNTEFSIEFRKQFKQLDTKFLHFFGIGNYHIEQLDFLYKSLSSILITDIFYENDRSINKDTFFYLRTENIVSELDLI
jgi:hypothetical protein